MGIVTMECWNSNDLGEGQAFKRILAFGYKGLFAQTYFKKNCTFKGYEI